MRGENGADAGIPVVADTASDQDCVYGHVTGCATQDFFSFFFLEEEFVLCPLYECPSELFLLSCIFRVDATA